MFRRKRQKIFVNINFSPYKKRNWLKIAIEQLSELEKRDLIAASLSIASFISIFISWVVFNNLIEEKKREIKSVEAQIRKTTYILRRVKREYLSSDNKFKTLYISGLKEKVFYILYTKYYSKKVWETVEKYKDIVNSISPFIGFIAFPNPYFGFKGEIQPIKKSEFHKVIYTKLTDNLLKRYSNEFASEPTLYIDKFKVEKKFLRDLEKIRDNQIKANLLLQYGLIYKNLNLFKVHTPITVVFPVNLAFPSEEIYRVKMNSLKEFCNKLIINREYRQEIFINNGIRSKTVIDGICIKNVF